MLRGVCMSMVCQTKGEAINVDGDNGKSMSMTFVDDFGSDSDRLFILGFRSSRSCFIF